MTIFDWIKNILVTKKHWDDFTEDEQKKFSPFIINRWLSMDKDFIEIVNVFQKYAIGTLEPREVYKWYCDVLAKGKRFNKYIKGKRDKKYDNELVNIISNHSPDRIILGGGVMNKKHLFFIHNVSKTNIFFIIFLKYAVNNFSHTCVFIISSCKNIISN